MPVIDSKKSFVIFIVVSIALVALGNLVSRNFFFRLDLTEIGFIRCRHRVR